MISDEIKSVVAVLKTLDTKASESADTIQCCLSALQAAAEQSEELEKNLYALAQGIEERLA